MSIASDLVLRKYLSKLERSGKLPEEERSAFLALPILEQNFDARRNITFSGARILRSIFIGSGLISRVKVLKDGTRQIVAFGIPGDAPDLQSLLLQVADHNLYTHAFTHIVSVLHEDIKALTAKYPLLANALWLDTLIEASISREWTVNVGQRKAAARIAHLLLEMEARFVAIGHNPVTYVLPLNQTELSQALALSLVHLNKTLQQMRAAGLVEVKSGRVTILDREALEKLSGFDDLYLHLGPHETGLADADVEVPPSLAPSDA